MPVVLWEAVPETLRRTIVSRHAEALFGYPIARWTSEPTFWHDHIYPEDRARATAEMRALVKRRGGSSRQLRYRFLDAAGEILWVTDLVSVQRDKSGKAEVVMGATVDVSDFRRWRELRGRSGIGRRRARVVKRRPVRSAVSTRSSR